MSLSSRHIDLLLSRLFHDLIGPVSASRNGLELVREFGADDIGAEAMDLVATSVDQTAARLTFFRMAFGGAGSGGGIGFLDIRAVVAEYLSHRKIEPRVSIADGLEVPRPGIVKTVLGLVVVAAESLPRGGTVILAAEPDRVTVRAEGRDAAIADQTVAALEGKIEPENEVIVVPATVGANARRFDVEIRIANRVPPELVIDL